MNIEKWIAEHSYYARAIGGRVVTDIALRALFAGKVLVPVDALGDVLNLAGYSVTHTGLDSSLRKSFIQVADLITASQERTE